MSATAAPATALPGSPYKGLTHYSAQDADFFFGREREVSLIAANLVASRLTLVYGGSGVGKSSLLRAGVERRLREEADESFRARGAPDAVQFVFSSWRDDPLEALAAALAAAAAPFAGDAPPPQGPPGRLDLLLAAWSERLDAPILVVLDQFEEYFLYHGDEDGEGTFAVEFPRAVNRPDLRANFVVSIREDALARLDRFKGRIPLLFDTYLRVEHLDREAARAAIERPLERWNALLPPDAEPFELEPRLTEAVLEQVRTGEVVLGEGGRGVAANGAGPQRDRIETPFLQLVMTRLWNEELRTGSRTLRLSTLERLGGARRIVRAHLDETMDALPAPEQDVAASVFRFLVTPSRTKIAHAAADLAEYTGLPEGEIEPVLQRLSAGGSRILRPVPPPPGEPGGERFEIFHDVLAEPLLEWRRRHERAREREADALRQRAVRRRLVLIAAGLLALALAFAGFAAWALHERGVAARRADVAESQALAARSLRALALDPRHGLALAAQAETKRATPQAEEALRRALVAWPKPTALVPRGRKVFGVAFSPDGRLVVAAGRGGAVVWSTTGRPVATLLPRQLVYSARFSRDGQFVVTAGADGAIRVWRVSGWRELPGGARILPGLLARAAFTDDGRFLVAGGHPGWPNRVWRFRGGRIEGRVTPGDGLAGWIDRDGSARVVDAPTAVSAARLTRGAPFDFASSRNGKLLVVADGYDATRVYRTAARRRVASLPAASGAVFSPNGRQLALEGGATVIWNLAGAQPGAVLAGSAAGVAFSDDSRLVVGASATRRIARVWDARTGARLAELPPRPPRFHGQVSVSDPYPQQTTAATAPQGLAKSEAPSKGPGPAFELHPAASFSPDGNLVATWGRTNGGAQLWEPFGTRRLAVLRTASHTHDLALLLPVAVSADGARIATAGPNDEVEVSSAEDGRRLATLRGSTDFVSSIAFGPDGDVVAAASFDRMVRIWRVADGSLLATLRGHTARVGGVAFSPDGTLLATASEDGTTRVWRVRDGAPVRVLGGQGGPVTSVSFSADGRSLVSGGAGGTARVWSTRGWRRLGLLGPTDSGTLVVRASISRDGKSVSTLDLDGTARIWRSAGGRPIRVLDNVGSVAFDPAGGRVVTAGGDATARVLRAADGAQDGLLRGHTNVLSAASFGAGGDLIVTASEDGTARVWEAATEGTVAVVRPSPAAVVDAFLAADGRLVTVSDDGVRVFECEPCLQPGPLRALAEKRLG